MATTTFAEFLAWSRIFIARNGRDEWRSTWLERRSSQHPVRCAGYRCRESALLSSGSGNHPADEEGHTACSSCGRCWNHCECYWCQNCDNPSDSSCGDCEQCTDCCECVHCSYCGVRCNGSRCSECEHCSDHCECSDGDRNIELFTHAVRFHPAKLHERKDNPSARFVSVEIEVAEIDSGHEAARAVRKWRGSIVEDGSLPDTGFEINTAPAAGDKFVEQIDEICCGLASGEAHVTSSCGLHVHVDARDFDYYMIRRLVNVYAAIEDALFGMASPSRRSSQYCIPCGASYKRAVAEGLVPYKAVKDSLHRRLYEFTPPAESDPERRCIGRTLRDRKKQKYDAARYSALNLHSWFYRGTVECRIFNGTTNAEKIVCWGMLWARILDYVAGHTDKEATAELAGSPYENLIKIAGLSRLVDFIRERTAKFNPHKEAA